MNTISIIVTLAIAYTVFVGWMAGNYKAEIKRECEAKMKEQGVKLISKDVHIEMLKDRITYLKRGYNQYVNDAAKEREQLHKQIRLLTPTEPDGN